MNSFQYAAAVTTPILTAGTLSATVWDMPVEVTQKIVVLNGTDFDRPRAYIQTYIPTYRNQLEFGDVSADVTHFGDRPLFAGWIFTHDLDGGLIALEFWRAGVIKDYIIIPMATPENYDQAISYVTNMMQGLKLYRQSAATRVITDRPGSDSNPIQIDEVIVIGYRNTYKRPADPYIYENTGNFQFLNWSGLISGGGSGGGSGGSSEPAEPQPKPLPVKDTFARTNIPETVSKQWGLTCITECMEITAAIFGKPVADCFYQDYYDKHYETDVEVFGVIPENLAGLLNTFFTTTSFTNYIDAINKGYLIYTDITSTTPLLNHNILIVGYDSTGQLIYIDTETGKQGRCKPTTLFNSYIIVVTGIK